MGLTQGQKAMIARVQSLGSGGQAVALTDGACAYLVAVIVRDLELRAHFPEIPETFPEVFNPGPLSRLELAGVPFLELFERLAGLDPNSDVYFESLAVLHKARLKYERILETQAVPTLDQVGPRGLLQYGGMNPSMLAGFLLWRKWVFDIDNRAGQETGYLFEPIIAAAVGGVPESAGKSPVKRRKDGNRGRQVDCLRENRAYEIKIRMTIAASGQGRWGEELDFPEDCRQSGYVPVLVVLDPTPSPKLDELRATFLDAGGEVYVGRNAWAHLGELAGPTMARFLDRYVHDPLQALLAEEPTQLPALLLEMGDEHLTVCVGDEEFSIARAPQVGNDDDPPPSDPEQQDDPSPVRRFGHGHRRRSRQWPGA